MSAAADTFQNADPISVDVDLDTRINNLDQLGKDLDSAVDWVDRAEAVWDEKYDLVEEDLKDEYKRLGRGAAPSEAAITSHTRKIHRDLYQDYRKAKRHLDKVEKKLRAAQSLVSARQTQSNGLRDEMKMGTYAR